MRIVLIILLTANAIFVSFAQTNSPAVIMSSGTFTAGDDASLSWTIGESLIESYSEESATLLQGFNVCIFPCPERASANSTGRSLVKKSTHRI